MSFKVILTKESQKSIKKIDPKNQRLILSWIKKNLIDNSNPRIQGKALQGNLKGLWRYRVGNYRIDANIKDNELLIIVIDVGNRKDIYKS